MKKFSAYTVVSNCTDLTDIRDGIAEIHEAMKARIESGKHIPAFYVSRLAKLETKKKKLEKRTQVHMTVTIRFFIDDDTLTMAVRHCLFFKLGPTRQNVMKAIRDTVRNNGRSILDFVCFYLLTKGSNNRSTSSFLFSTGILLLPLAMISAAKSLLRPAMYFCRFPLMMASIRKSCRVFSIRLISDTKKPSSIS